MYSAGSCRTYGNFSPKDCLNGVRMVQNICGRKTCHMKNPRSVIYVTVKRGEIYYADLSPVIGSEQGGVRPVLIVQNDVGNRYSPTVIAAAITSQKEKSKLPTHIEINSQVCGLSRDSVVLLEQIRTIDKKRLKEKMGRLDDGSMGQVNHALSISFGLGDNPQGSQGALT